MDVQPYYQCLVDAFAKCGSRSGFKVVAERIVLNPMQSAGEDCWELSFKNGTLVLKGDVSSGGINGLARMLGFATGEFKIFIHPREVIKQGEPWNIKASVVELAYVAQDSSKSKSDLLLGMHYDFSARESGDPEFAHPLFHAQFTSKLYRLQGALGASIGLDRMKNLPSVRLPTAHMSLPSVLLLVAADNFTPSQFTAFLREVRKSPVYPCARNQLFATRMTQHNVGMRSCAWYGN